MPQRVRPVTKPRCQSCRLRKVKCDYVKPKCGPCSRLHLLCREPDKTLVFVPQTFGDDGTGRHIFTKVSETTSRPDILRIAPRMRSVPSALPQGIGSCRQQIVFQQFITQFMPRKASVLDIFEAHWITRLPDTRRRFKPLHLAVDALAMAVCAEANADAALQVEAMKLYGQSLGHLSRYYASRTGVESLWHEAALTSVLLSLMDLTFFLAAQSTSNDVLVKPGAHLKGVSNLLQKGTMANIRDPRFQSTFSLVRVSMVRQNPTSKLGGVFMPKSLTPVQIVQSILGNFHKISESAWCVRPWGAIMDDPLHRALDVLLDVVGYRVAAAALCEAEYDAQDVSNFEEQRKQIQANFQLWYTNESCSRGSTLFRQAWLPADETDSLRKSIGYDIHFDSIRYRLAMSTYWVGKLILFLEWERVQMHAHGQAAHFPTSVGVVYAQELAEATTIADHICVSILQLVDDEQGIIGLSSVLMPLWAAHYFFRAHGMVHRLEWCRRLLQKQMCWPFKATFMNKNSV
ncbi:hypothetical protein NLG97_g6274 [Lecanicillium saksenae]|uniref:Uncharacterized protein n=1 Tax=Lecanicillium saksenae TaxID=468837 RepID=A0ACC1QQ33_9HYPO|nr:hypothetical protein NLG97_g6274 [Lecanicillium saksenae]